jgi:hypothetical protein
MKLNETSMSSGFVCGSLITPCRKEDLVICSANSRTKQCFKKQAVESQMKRRIDFAHWNITEKTSGNQDTQAQRLLELPEKERK